MAHDTSQSASGAQCAPDEAKSSGGSGHLNLSADSDSVYYNANEHAKSVPGVAPGSEKSSRSSFSLCTHNNPQEIQHLASGDQKDFYKGSLGDKSSSQDSHNPLSDQKSFDKRFSGHNSFSDHNAPSDNAPSFDRKDASDHTAPSVDHKASFSDNKAPFLDNKAPSVDHSASFSDNKAPSVDHKAPFFDNNAPFYDNNAQFSDKAPSSDKSPSSDHEAPSDHKAPAPSLDHKVPFSDNKAPFFDDKHRSSDKAYSDKASSDKFTSSTHHPTSWFSHDTKTHNDNKDSTHASIHISAPSEGRTFSAPPTASTLASSDKHRLSINTHNIQPPSRKSSGLTPSSALFDPPYSALSTNDPTQREPFASIDNILKFPIESSHAYSYAHLSPNSLALRLNVLKRSLEILKDRPSLFKSMNNNHTNPDTSNNLTALNTNDSDLVPPPSLDNGYNAPNNNHRASFNYDVNFSNNIRHSISSVGSNGSSQDLDTNVKLSQLMNYNENDDKLLTSFKSGNRSSFVYRNPSANNSGDFSFASDNSGTKQPNNNNNKYKIQSNASSAALAALFRPPMKRSDSLPVNQLYSHKFASASSLDLVTPSPPPEPKGGPSARSASSSSHRDSTSSKRNAHSNNTNNGVLNQDLKDIVKLLEKDELTLSNSSEIATTLHNLSLSSNKEEDQQMKENFLKNKLLYALATPFVETSAVTSALLGTPNMLTNVPTPSGTLTPVTSSFAGAMPTNSNISHNVSSATLSSFNYNNNNNLAPLAPAPSVPGSTGKNRPFHSISSGKHAAPQSVFTVELDSPWSLKAANDLACLMFGVSKNTIRNLTLMDLIAPQFRNFVTDRLMRIITGGLSFKSKNQERSLSHNIIFAGEIIAISRPGDKQYAWTSMWAKKKGNLIIIMFDQIPCDAFDVVVSSDRDETSRDGYKIQSIDEIAGKLINKYDRHNLKSLKDLSDSMDHDLRTNGEEPNDNSNTDFINYYLSQDVSDSEKINRTRYYTLQLGDTDGENIPCAVTSNPLEINPDKYEVKLKIHTLPYIAGIFILRASDLKILSCNNAIAKNLFGRSFDELTEQSIDFVIPQFSEILQIGLDFNDDDLSVVPGLVLPEHFFRKYDAVLKCEYGVELDENDEPLNEEELFLSSHGIRGLHRDGRSLYVDVQLRVSTNDTYVLWVTYSRQTSKSNANISKELDRLNRTASSLSIPQSTDEKSPGFKRSRLNNSDDIDDVGLPSQLKLLPDNEADIMDINYSSAEVSRQNSTRRPKANTFAIPLRHLNDALADAVSTRRIIPESPAKKRVPSTNDSVISQDSRASVSPSRTEGTTASSLGSDLKVTSHEGKDQADYDSDGTHRNSVDPLASPSSGEIMSYKKYSEEDILKVENDLLSEKASKSNQWPQKIGAKKRSKKFAEFRVVKDMGEGAYGKVVLAEHKEDPIYRIIIKCIDKERILVDTWVRDRTLGTIPSEIQIMAFLNNEPHPNIMRIIDYFEDPKYYYLETPIFGNPPAIDLFDFIEIKKDMSELECQFIFKQIVSAIYHLHKNGIVHRDIKDENVIVDENGIIKLIDFGSAGYVKSGPFDVFVGTIDYASPEVLRGEKYEGKPQDIWALGILLYTLLYKENPFYNVDEIMEGDLRVPYVVSESSLELIKKILNKEVDQRPSITDIVEDAWLDI